LREIERDFATTCEGIIKTIPYSYYKWELKRGEAPLINQTNPLPMRDSVSERV
jgi:hypothetical protein